MTAFIGDIYLLLILKEFQIPSNLITMISISLEKTYCKIKMPNCNSDSFEVTTDLRQGDPLSPAQFNLVLEKIDRKFYSKNLTCGGMHIGDKIILRLAYAYDVFLLSESKEELGNMV